MNYIAALLVFSLAVPATAVELLRYGGAANDGGTLEYVFESDETDVAKTVSKERVARRLYDHLLRRARRRTGDPRVSDDAGPVLARLLSDMVKGPLCQMFFVVVLPDGKGVEPSVSKRL
jgi:hypothetical protein